MTVDEALARLTSAGYPCTGSATPPLVILGGRSKVIEDGVPLYVHPFAIHATKWGFEFAFEFRDNMVKGNSETIEQAVNQLLGCLEIKWGLEHGTR